MKVVFVCTGNTCRSPMAEAMLRSALAERGVEGVAVRSAGLCAHPGAPMSHDAVCELQRRDLPFFRTRATRLTREMVQGACVLCMAAWQVEQVRRMGDPAYCGTLNQYAGLPGDVDDPFGGGERAYRRAADQIEQAVNRIADQLQKGIGQDL